jgi:hypothetical protein
MALRTPDTKDEQDQAHNPARHFYDEKFNQQSHPKTADDLQNRESQAGTDAGIDQLESYADDPANATKSIDKAREEEQAGGNTGGWENNTTTGTPSKGGVLGKGSGWKKKSPLALILLLLFGGGGLLMVLFSPGMLIVNLKEKMNEKFNDQLAAMDVRTTALLKKKFKGATKGVCTSKISIRCKFETLSDRHLKKLATEFENRGGKVNSEKTIVGRNKIVNVEYKGKVIDANNFFQEIRGNPEFRSVWYRGYNPKLAGFADEIFSKLSKKIGLSKQKNITGNDEKERRKAVLDAANGTAAAEADVRVSSTEEACEDGSQGCENGKRTVYTDETTGERISKEQYDSRINNSGTLTNELQARKALSETGGTVAKATLKGALTSTAFGLGAVDSACTGYLLIRTVGFAAKYLGMLQLVRYAHVFNNTADAIKASGSDKKTEEKAAEGDSGTPNMDREIRPEDVEYVGNILTAVNSEGKAATDSYGYKYAAYGDVMKMPRSDDVKAESVGAGSTTMTLSEEEQKRVEINDETTKYINGQLITDNLLSDIISLIDGGGNTTNAADDTCHFVKSGWGQAIVIGAALVGAVVAFFTGGISLGWGVGAQVVASVAISVAIAMLQPKLADMAAGTMIGDSELKNGNRTGNALTSGNGGLNHLTSEARGVAALQKEDAPEYQAQTASVMSQYAAMERLDSNPLDPTNPHTFMGSIVSNLIPYTTKFSSLTGGISGVMEMTTASFASLLPNAAAVDPSAQFNVCEDADYIALNLAVDPFCNVRHGLNPQTLSVDPDTVAAYMERNFADEVSGQPKDPENEYAKYVKNCMERGTALGAFTDDNDNKGEECIQGSASKNPSRDANCSSGDEGANTECRRNMFRIYFIDLSVNDGMDNGEVAKNASSKTDAVSGDAKALAEQVANNPNVAFVNPATKEQLLKFSRGEQVVDSCGKPMTISKYLLGALQANSTKYKILVNNIGFKEDRSMCESGTLQHPKGTAVDLNNIEIIGGASTGGSIRIPGTGLAVVNQYATDFLATLPLNRGGVGQKNCGVNPVFPPGSVALNGSHLFNDACNHLHIDARNRENLNDTE